MKLQTYSEAYNLPLASKQLLIAKLDTSMFIQYFACSTEDSDAVGIKKLFDPKYQEVVKVLDINFIARNSHVISGAKGTGKTSLLKQIITHNKDLVLIYLDLTKLDNNYYLTISSMYENELYPLVRDDVEAIIPENLIAEGKVCFLIDNYDLVDDKTKNETLDFVYDVGVANRNKVFIAASENIADFSRITLKRWEKEQILQFFDSMGLELSNKSFRDRLFEQGRTASFVSFIAEISLSTKGVPDNFAMLNQLYLLRLLEEIVDGTPFEVNDILMFLKRIADLGEPDYFVSRRDVGKATVNTDEVIEVFSQYPDYNLAWLLQVLIDYGILERSDRILGSYYKFCDRSIHYLLLAIVYLDPACSRFDFLSGIVSELLEDPSYCSVIYYYLELSGFEQADKVLSKAETMGELTDSAQKVLRWIKGSNK